MELMTHQGLFDFDANRQQEGAIHEGLWLHEPGVTVEEYQRYFAQHHCGGAAGRRAVHGTDLAGLRVRRLHAAVRRAAGRRPQRAEPRHVEGPAQPGQGREVPRPHRPVLLRFQRDATTASTARPATGQYGVYDLMPNAVDHFGIWENNPKRVDPDYYITDDGKSGIIVRHVQAGAPYCIWYAHWQGLNPAKGVGWPAFTTVVERIRKHLRDVSSGCGPARSRIAITRPAGGGSWQASDAAILP